MQHEQLLLQEGARVRKGTQALNLLREANPLAIHPKAWRRERSAARACRLDCPKRKRACRSPKAVVNSAKKSGDPEGAMQVASCI